MTPDTKYLVDARLTFKAGKNRVFVSLPSATLEGYKRESGLYIVPDQNKRQEEKAAVIGTVVSADPETGLFPGDVVAVNYMVTSTGRPVNGGFEHERAWLIENQLVWECLQEVYSDEEHSQGKFDNQEIIAVKQGNDWIVLGNYCLLQKVEVPNPNFINTSLEIPDNLATVILQDRGKLVSGNCGAPTGTIVAIERGYADTYVFENGEEYLVIPSQYILGYYAEP